MSNRYWAEDFIGVLAEDDPLAPANNQAIFINNQESLQFQVKIISQPPESFPNVKHVNCFATYLEKWGFEDNPSLTDIERKQSLRDFLSEALLIFNVEKKLLYNHSEVYNANNIRLISKSESYTNNVSLIPLAIFSEESHGINYYEFIQRLQNRKFVGRIDNISKEPNDTPTYIIWKKNDQTYFIFGEFDKHQYAHGGFSLSIRGELKEAEFSQEWLVESYFHQKHVPNLLFVTLEHYKLIEKIMETAENCQGSDINTNFESDYINKPSTNKLDSNKKATSSLVNISEKTSPEKSNLTSLTENTTQTVESESNIENKFLEHFFEKTEELGLSYSKKDLVNFHTAMKSSNLVILAGMSGTGKSKLVNSYRRALGLDTEQFTFISVRPSWTDDSDIIGYADTLNMVYRPGDSGLINVLKQAEKEEEKLFIICFDEMNLARVEHYFSQFLSILELEPGQRQVRLYNDELANRLYNSAQYPPTIMIKENVIFVGTVNIDESTYHFSDKVLDRANVIQLEVLPFNLLFDLEEKKRSMQSRDKGNYYEDYESFKNNSESIELSPQEISFLWDLHTKLQEVSKQTGIGPRIVKQIDYYIKNLPNTTFYSRQEAFDDQIVQRVFTKIRGSEDQLHSLLGTYDKSNHNVVDSFLWDLVENYDDVSNFIKTKSMIIQKARELKLNGYTI